MFVQNTASTIIPSNAPDPTETPDIQEQIDNYIKRAQMEFIKCAEASQQFSSLMEKLNGDLTNPDTFRESLVDSLDSIIKLGESCSNLSIENPPEPLKGLNEILNKIENQIQLFSSTAKTCVDDKDMEKCRQSVSHSKEVVNSFKDLFESDYWQLLFPETAEEA